MEIFVHNGEIQIPSLNWLKRDQIPGALKNTPDLTTEFTNPEFFERYHQFKKSLLSIKQRNLQDYGISSDSQIHQLYQQGLEMLIRVRQTKVDGKLWNWLERLFNSMYPLIRMLSNIASGSCDESLTYTSSAVFHELDSSRNVNVWVGWQKISLDDLLEAFHLYQFLVLQGKDLDPPFGFRDVMAGLINAVITQEDAILFDARISDAQYQLLASKTETGYTLSPEGKWLVNAGGVVHRQPQGIILFDCGHDCLVDRDKMPMVRTHYPGSYQKGGSLISIQGVIRPGCHPGKGLKMFFSKEGINISIGADGYHAELREIDELTETISVEKLLTLKQEHKINAWFKGIPIDNLSQEGTNYHFPRMAGLINGLVKDKVEGRTYATYNCPREKEAYGGNPDEHLIKLDPEILIEVEKGESKYVLAVEKTDWTKRFVIAAIPGLSHPEIVRQIRRKVEPLGGGFLEINIDEKMIKIYGKSEAYGYADTTVVRKLLQQEFLGWKIKS